MVTSEPSDFNLLLKSDEEALRKRVTELKWNLQQHCYLRFCLSVSGDAKMSSITHLVSSSTACQCDAEGTLPEGCDKQTGACLCRPGVTGARCDSCGPGHCDSFPACETCPSCFFTLGAQRQNLSLALERLSPSFPSRPGGGGDLGNFGPRIHALEASLNLIRNSISLPPSTARQVDDALSQLNKLR